MENEVVIRKLNTSATGKINGCNTSIVYETTEDAIPQSIYASCVLVPGTDPMHTTVVNVNINIMGLQNRQIDGVTITGDLPLIISKIEELFKAYMVNAE